MHPLVDNVYRTDATTVGLIATNTTAIGATHHLVQMVTARTRLGRVRLTWNAVTTQLVFQGLFQPPELQCPNLLIGSPGPAMPLFVIERARISCIEDGELLRHTEIDDLVGGMVEGLPTHPVDLLAETAPSAVEALAPPRPGLRAPPLFLESPAPGQEQMLLLKFKD